MKKSLYTAASLAVLAMLCLVALSFRRTDPAAGQSAETTSATSIAAAPPSQVLRATDRRYAVAEETGHSELVTPARVAPLPATMVEPLFEPDARVKIGEKAMLRFAARDRASGLPQSIDHLSASVFHGNDPELHVPVEEVENGVYEVGFTPHGPGQFNVVLNDNGVAVGSRKVGAIGVAGATAGADPGDFLSVDPRSYRARTPGKGRLR